ncbi:tetraacyldisaccharide 4'-kinase, partial [Planctomycetota bacterium]
GLLRESLKSLKRAHAIVFTRCDQVNECEIEKIENKLNRINTELIFSRTIHSVVNIISIDNKTSEIEQLKGEKVFAFCGIGNPKAFFTTINTLGADITGTLIYDDHHHYTKTCIADIYEKALQSQAKIILTTHKDSTKIKSLIPEKTNIPLAYTAIEIKFTSGEDKLRNLIELQLSGTILKK